jgi:hypothetical protein
VSLRLHLAERAISLTAEAEEAGEIAWRAYLAPPNRIGINDGKAPGEIDWSLPERQTRAAAIRFMPIVRQARLILLSIQCNGEAGYQRGNAGAPLPRLPVTLIRDPA